MYTIEKRDWGYYLTFGGFIKSSEMEQWSDDIINAMQSVEAGFGILADMRHLKILPRESKEAMQRGQKFAKSKGVNRSVHIHSNEMITGQFRRIAKETGVYAKQRYIDASSNPDWEEKATKWISEGLDPDGELDINLHADHNETNV